MSTATTVGRKKAKTPVRKPVMKAARQSAAARRRVDRKGSAGTPAPGGLTGWAGLGAGSKLRTGKRRAVTTGFIDAISTRRFVLIVLAIAAVFTLYIGHVHATQNVLAEVQQQRKLNHNLNLKYNRLKGEFDRMTGPATIYNRARDLGLNEDVAYGPTIRAK